MTVMIGIDPHKASHTAVVIAEGKNTKEAIRALKRQLSNVTYRSLVADARRLEQ